MKKSTVSNVIAIARPGSKRDEAVKIFKEVAGGDAHRQETLKAFQKQLAMEPTTAATYYHFCVTAIEQAQSEQTERAIASTSARKYSAVKYERGSDSVVSKFQVFLKKSDAQAFNDQLNYNAVIPGVARIGKAI